MDAYTAKGTIFKEQSSCSIQNVTSKTQKLTVPSGFGLQMTLFSLSLAASILISQGPLDDVKQGLGPAVLWGPSKRVLVGLFLQGWVFYLTPTLVLSVPRTDGTASPMVSRRVLSLLRMKMGKLGLCAGSKSKVYRWALESVSVY